MILIQLNFDILISVLKKKINEMAAISVHKPNFPTTKRIMFCTYINTAKGSTFQSNFNYAIFTNFE